MPETDVVEEVTTQTQQQTSTATAQASTGKTFTQAEVDQLIKDRLEREKAKREKDAEAAKQKAEAEAAAKNGEFEKLAKQREAEKAELQARLDKLEADRQADRLRAAIEKAAAVANFHDPADAIAHLDVASLKLKDDNTVEGLDKALEALTKAKPYLIKQKQSGAYNPTNPGAGNDAGETTQQRLARIHGYQNSSWEFNR